MSTIPSEGHPLVTSRFFGIAVVVLATLGFAASVDATVLQLTSHEDPSCTMFKPVANKTGSRIVFESTCDLTGSNADGNREIFMADPSGAVSQLTDSVSCANMNPAMSSDGVVFFDSDCDLTGANADGSIEIFSVAVGVTSQLTDGQFCSSLTPSVDNSGSQVAYASDCDPVGANVDRSWEIFELAIGGSLVQMTSDTTGNGCGSFDPAMSGSGDVILFDSDCDLTGENADQIVEIFRVDKNKLITQVTRSTDDACENGPPRTNGDGQVFVFESTCDLSGSNTDGSVEIFRRTKNGTIEQLTNDPSGLCDSTQPVIGEDGAVVTYVSFCDPTGENTDASFEIFRVENGKISQLTAGSGCDSFSATTDAAEQVTFIASDCDVSGTNGDLSDEIFSYSECTCGVPARGLSQPTATDALFALHAAVGLTICSLCECDVDSDLQTTATDALLILKKAVGESVSLVCSL